MPKSRRTPAGDALTDLMLDLFRLNSLLLTAGDRLRTRLGLTSARWHLLGAIVKAERPQPVAWLARDLSANRQNVQRIVNDLHSEGLVAFDANPHHRRAQLVVLLTRGSDLRRRDGIAGPVGQRPLGRTLRQGPTNCSPFRRGATEETREQRRRTWRAGVAYAFAPMPVVTRMSANGTNRTNRAGQMMSVDRGGPECAGRPARSRWCKSITMKE